MDHPSKRWSVVCLFAGLALGAGPAEAGPIDFLKRVGASIAHSHHAQSVHRVTRKSKVEREDAKPSGQVPADKPTSPIATATPAAEALAKPSSTPSPPPVRAANGVPPRNFSRDDLPYGVPVPNKPGFVTSPYSPNGGYVDVRGYPSGIEVKDPYTGKIFRTP